MRKQHTSEATTQMWGRVKEMKGLLATYEHLDSGPRIPEATQWLQTKLQWELLVSKASPWPGKAKHQFRRPHMLARQASMKDTGRVAARRQKSRKSVPCGESVKWCHSGTVKILKTGKEKFRMLQQPHFWVYIQKNWTYYHEEARNIDVPLSTKALVTVAPE